MWKAGRKFHARNQYGKKRKKSLLENFKGRSASARSAERASDPPSVASGEAPDNIGLAPPPPPAQDNASSSGRVRLDTAVLHPLEVAEVRRNAENKLQELASTGATQRKCGLLADIDDAAATLLDETRFLIEKRFDRGRHFPKKSEQKYASRCQSLDGRSKTRYLCDRCNMPLCPQCLQSFHSA
ncbi:hypothetical protein MRX96_057716 [Rhipicephalus microplus]